MDSAVRRDARRPAAPRRIPLFTRGALEWALEETLSNPGLRSELEAFLHRCGLELDAQASEFVTVRSKTRLVACAGMDQEVVKCVAVEPALRGENITAGLMTEVTHRCAEQGRYHLFLYTKPSNAELFAECGFYPIVEMPGTVMLMENTPTGIARYCESLAALRKSGDRIGSIVMNANPFTYGHQYLARQAHDACDWLHVFVVGENASLVTYQDRYALVREGLKELPRVTLHGGSPYMISRATFPSYFLKDRGNVDACYTAIDLLIFSERVAPALGITHRFVGTEPFCPVTRKYNADMKHWLMRAPSMAPPVEVVEIERTQRAGRAISASEVRRRLREDDFDAMSDLAPPATIALLRDKYFDPEARRPTGTG